MHVELPLDRMTLVEKLEVMERLWADLSSSDAQLPSPEWHRDVLQERQRLVASGQLKFADFDAALAELRSELDETKSRASYSV